MLGIVTWALVEIGFSTKSRDLPMPTESPYYNTEMQYQIGLKIFLLYLGD